LTFERQEGCSELGTTVIRWDLDGDGKLENEGQNCENATVQHRYDSPGTYTVSSDVAFTSTILGIWVWVHGYSSQQVVIGSPPPQPAANSAPVARFSTDASPGYTERPVHFDASASDDTDGRIVKYEWDFTSDGTWDATGVTVDHAFGSAGDYTTTLRVTDDKGAVGTTQRSVPVVDGVPPGESRAASSGLTAARAAPFTTSLSGALIADGQGFINGGTLSNVGMTARGKMKLRGLPKPFARKRSAKWAALFSTKQHGTNAGGKLAVEGFLLVDFGRRDRVCLSGRVSGTIAKPWAGRFAVVGGSGRGARLRGGATLAVPTNGTTVKGKLNLASTRKARGLPKTCRSLVRLP
jgi:hypothetical protein